MTGLNIQTDWIMKCVVTKFDRLRLDNGGDIVMTTDAMDFHAKLSSDDCRLMVQSSNMCFVLLMH